MSITLLLTSFFISCGSLKSQKNRKLDDIKQLAKLNFELQFRANKRAKVKKNEAYIYFTVKQNEHFIYFLTNEQRMRSIIKDSVVVDQLFNKREIDNYKKQLTHNSNIEAIEKYIDSDSIRRKPEIDEGKEILGGSVYTMMVPVFSIDGNYAIFIAALEGNFSSIMIYEKNENKWVGKYQYIIGIS